MLSCWNCHAVLPEGAKFCGRCGNKQDTAASVLPSSLLTVPHSTQLVATDLVHHDQPVATDLHHDHSAAPTFTIYSAVLPIKTWLAEHRATIAAKLLTVLVYVNTRRNENRELFETNSGRETPPLEDRSWDKVAFIAGLYARFMWRYELNAEQKRNLWDALCWSVLYERALRPKMADARFAELVGFFNGCAGDSEFFAYMLLSMPLLLEYVDTSNIHKLLTASERLGNSSDVVHLRALLHQRLVMPADVDLESTQLTVLADQPGPRREWARIILAIEHLWQFLDKKRESSNQRALTFARENPMDSTTPSQLATLGGVICRNVVFRYAHNSTLPGSMLTAEQLADAIALAEYSIRYSSGDYIGKAEYYYLLLSSLRDLRTHVLSADVLVSALKRQFAPEGLARISEFSWSDLLGIVTRYLSECRLAETIDVVEVESWIRALADLAPQFQLEARKVFVSEVRQHGVRDSMALRALQGESLEMVSETHDRGPLAFLGQERYKELLTCIRTSRLDRLGEILREARPKLFAELSRLLTDQKFAEILPPRRSLRIRGRNANALDRFQEAKTLIQSENVAEQQEGLALFERAQADTAREYQPVAREWRLFAIACVRARYQAVPLWEEDRCKGVASWEEIWNLAVFYVHVGKIDQALELLVPGVERQRAPFSHLRFALYCSVQILGQGSHSQHESIEAAETFLMEHLKQYPLPECYLAWSLLVSERESVDRAQSTNNMMKQLTILTKFNELLDHPILILKPEESVSDSALETFEKELRRLDLDDVWRFWIHDYAQRNRYKFSAWQALSDAYERAGESTGAEKSLKHVADTQLDMYLKQREKSSAVVSNLLHLRNHLCKLFDFYQRQGRLLDDDVFARFKHYRTTVPELWHERESANTKLIKQTRPLLEKLGRTGSTNESSATQAPQKAWYALASELTTVQEIATLKSLQARIHTHVHLLTDAQKQGQDDVAGVLSLLDDLCSLEGTRWRHDELSREVERLNSAIQEVGAQIEQEAALKPLKALLETFRRVFKRFSEMQHLAPELEIEPTPLGGGLPDDMPETALVIRIHNPGPGKVSDLRISCTEKGLTASQGEVTLNCLEQGENAVVAIPVLVQVPAEAIQLDFQITLTYQWGIIKDMSCICPLKVRLFNFHDFLRQHDIHDYELPNPYIFNRPIDFSEDDHRLFQGRESELALIRTIFFKRQMTGAPLYFHGIRRVGKTSLLNRIVLELRKEAFFPCVVDLKSVKAAQHPLEVTINSFTQSILRDAQSQGLDVEGLESVGASHPDPLLGVERFFAALRERTGRLQLVLLLDEFYLLVAERTTPLLDLLRHIHQSGMILFIMSGWMRPEPLRRACPETQLFPLTERPLDFLSVHAVRQVLLAPVAGYGIEIPDHTVQRVFWQTAGNPYHVARMAYEGVDRLNAQHRTVLAPQDIDAIAERLASEPANFTSSLFSPLILSPEEQREAIRFARGLNGKRDYLDFAEASRTFDLDIIRGLEEKYILEYLRDEKGERLRVRSKMLATFLGSRMTEPIVLPPPPSHEKRVGLFVDYENLRPLMPASMTAREVGEMLVTYAARFGEVVCCWACADPRNIRDLASVKLELEQVGFQLQTPSGEPQTGQSSKNLSDFVLIERIIDESTHTDPSIYIIVSGDKDYYERINTLLNGGCTVRLCASISAGNLAEKYHTLETERHQYQLAEGKPERDFFIDDLDAVLKLKVNNP
ncbi:MAG TPA: NYN domain-containing protein [Ktedonobacteraceae bacterium]|nr:NYN domain-containing protein [Ktedonobacteraceae bacterium]